MKRCLFHSAGYAALLLPLLLCQPPAMALDSALALREIYAATVDRRLELPQEEQRQYAERITLALQQAGFPTLPAQYLLLVDRNPEVQAILLYWLDPAGQPEFIGASPVSTSMSGSFEYFETPLGIFDHSRANQDFRAEGSRNGKGIRGYGVKGMRVYDFGWVPARQTWRSGVGDMRLQIHTTDPDYLEPRLGSVQSKGCIRIPATLNTLIDRYGILDEGYDQALRQGKKKWLLRPDREPTPWSGRYLIVVDTERGGRPAWSPAPVIQSPASPAKKKRTPVHVPSSEPLPVSSPAPAPARLPPS